MSEQIPESCVGKVLMVQISHCPDLGLYHYVRPNEERFFTQEQLEQGLDGLIKQGKEPEADFMLRLAKWGKDYPHKVVRFFTDNTFDIRERTLIGKEFEVSEKPSEPTS